MIINNSYLKESIYNILRENILFQYKKILQYIIRLPPKFSNIFLKGIYLLSKKLYLLENLSKKTISNNQKDLDILIASFPYFINHRKYIIFLKRREKFSSSLCLFFLLTEPLNKKDRYIILGKHLFLPVNNLKYSIDYSSKLEAIKSKNNKLAIALLSEILKGEKNISPLTFSILLNTIYKKTIFILCHDELLKIAMSYIQKYFKDFFNKLIEDSIIKMENNRNPYFRGRSKAYILTMLMNNFFYPSKLLIFTFDKYSKEISSKFGIKIKKLNIKDDIDGFKIFLTYLNRGIKTPFLTRINITRIAKIRKILRKDRRFDISDALRDMLSKIGVFLWDN